jgi:chloramphenicol-sensitive protein RarD
MSSSSPDTNHSRNGAFAVAAACFIWGLFPLLLKPLQAVSALEIACWRTVSGCAVVFAWLHWRGELSTVRDALRNPQLSLRLLLSAILLSINWWFYAWGVGHHQVLVTSLGYFINPLVNVLLGILLLGEILNPAQWCAVALAAASVLLMSVKADGVPWLALVLAITFSVYGLLRKTTHVAALPGLAVETLLLTPIALIILVWTGYQSGDRLAYTQVELSLLICSGIVTILPLGLFHSGARLINYATVGMLQYVGPTIQFLIGVFIFNETLSPLRLACFAMIWLALVIYAMDGFWRARIAAASANA